MVIEVIDNGQGKLPLNTFKKVQMSLNIIVLSINFLTYIILPAPSTHSPVRMHFLGGFIPIHGRVNLLLHGVLYYLGQMHLPRS
jgi:hypothetical protein